MSVLERYISEVKGKFPAKHQDEIEKKVRILIHEKLATHSGENQDIDQITKVLEQLGDPNELAYQYTDKMGYLISPKNYNKYLFVLKIVFAAVFLGISVATAIGGIFSVWGDPVSIITNYFTTLLSGLFQAFTWVTVIFAMIDRKGIEVKEIHNKKQWTVKDLKEPVSKKARISPVEAIVGIVFSTIFMLMIYLKPELFAAYIPKNTGGHTSIPLFKIEVLKEYSFFILAIYLLAITKEIVKLVYGKWNIGLAIFYSILSLASMTLFILLFFNPDVWNADFGLELSQYLELDVELQSIWPKVSNGAMILILFGTTLDIGTAFYKGVKYHSTNRK